jgi:FMN reductase (NADPH)
MISTQFYYLNEVSMPNPAIEVIQRHGSVRQYKPDVLPNRLVESIVEAAQHTSSSSNLQTYSVVAVTDPAKRARLAELCGGQRHITEAPVFLTWCADLARLQRVCEIRGYTEETGYFESFLVAAVDAVIAAQSAAIAAESEGLGICYIGSIRNQPEAVIDLLGLPPLVFPVTGMTLGWPVEAPLVRPRLPLNEVLHWECYDTHGQDESLAAYDQAMLATGIYQNRQVPVGGAAQPVEAYGWMEHTARRAAQAVRVGLKDVINKRGFGLK